MSGRRLACVTADDTGASPDAYDRTWTVRFADADPFGIAHYPRIVEALHETADAFMDDIGHPFWELPERGYGLPVAEVDVEFHQPVEPGDRVAIAVAPDVSDRSVRFDFEATVDGEAVFEGYEQRVCVPADGGGSRELPADLRDALTE